MNNIAIAKALNDSLTSNEANLLLLSLKTSGTVELSKRVNKPRATVTRQITIGAQKAYELLMSNIGHFKSEYVIKDSFLVDMDKFRNDFGSAADIVIASVIYKPKKEWLYFKDKDILIYDENSRIVDDINKYIKKYSNDISVSKTYKNCKKAIKRKYAFMTDELIDLFIKKQKLVISNGFIVSLKINAALHIIIPEIIKGDYVNVKINVKDEEQLSIIKKQIIKKYDIDYDFSTNTLAKYIYMNIPIYGPNTYMYSDTGENDEYLRLITSIAKEVGGYKLRWEDLFNGYEQSFRECNILTPAKLHHIVAQLKLSGRINAIVSQYCVQFNTDEKQSLFDSIYEYLHTIGAGEFIEKEELELISSTYIVEKFFSIALKNHPNIYRTKGTVIDLSTLGVSSEEQALIKEVVAETVNENEYKYASIYKIQKKLTEIVKKYKFKEARYLFHYIKYLMPEYKYTFPGIMDKESGKTADEIFDDLIKKYKNRSERKAKALEVFDLAYKSKMLEKL